VYAPFRAKVAPDTTAAIFWLKNRRPDLWRDGKSLEIRGNLNISKAANELTDDDLAHIATGGSAGTADETAGAGTLN
jgi:hypothetical protein